MQIVVLFWTSRKEINSTVLAFTQDVLFVCLGASSLSKMLSACGSLKKPKWHLLSYSHQSVESNFLIQYCSYHFFLTKDTSLCYLKKCKSYWQPHLIFDSAGMIFPSQVSLWDLKLRVKKCFSVYQNVLQLQVLVTARVRIISLLFCLILKK